MQRTRFAPNLWAMAGLLIVLGCAPPGSPGAPGAQGAQGAQGQPQPSLVLLVSLDTLRADRVGRERPQTPTLDGLAAEGWRFETVLAQAAQTLVSHKSLFAGRYPLRLLPRTSAGWPTGAAARELLTNGLRSEGNALLETMGDAGWQRAAFTDGGWMRSTFGFDAAFDHFDEGAGGLEALVPRALAWLESSAGEGPTFAFLHAYDVHCPYPTRPAFDRRYCQAHEEHIDLEGRCPKDDLERAIRDERDWQAVRDHYDAGVESADAWLGALFQGMRELGIFEEALIVVTSDHGEGLGEGGRLGHGGLSLDELLVPLVVRFPASWSVEPREVRRGVELVDVMPTILEACGIAVPADLDGTSLLSLEREALPAADVLIAQTVFRERGTGQAVVDRSAGLVPGRCFFTTSGSGLESLRALASSAPPAPSEADVRAWVRAVSAAAADQAP